MIGASIGYIVLFALGGALIAVAARGIAVLLVYLAALLVRGTATRRRLSQDLCSLALTLAGVVAFALSGGPTPASATTLIILQLLGVAAVWVGIMASRRADLRRPRQP